MESGDLIQYRLRFMGHSAPWSVPSVVLRRFPGPDSGLWVVFADGEEGLVDLENYEIRYISHHK